MKKENLLNIFKKSFLGRLSEEKSADEARDEIYELSTRQPVLPPTKEGPQSLDSLFG